ncbi:methyltransferase domain-containing protein, partial [Thermoproteota archaeon]
MFLGSGIIWLSSEDSQTLRIREGQFRRTSAQSEAGVRKLQQNCEFTCSHLAALLIDLERIEQVRADIREWLQLVLTDISLSLEMGEADELGLPADDERPSLLVFPGLYIIIDMLHRRSDEVIRRGDERRLRDLAKELHILLHSPVGRSAPKRLVLASIAILRQAEAITELQGTICSLVETVVYYFRLSSSLGLLIDELPPEKTDTFTTLYHGLGEVLVSVQAARSFISWVSEASPEFDMSLAAIVETGRRRWESDGALLRMVAEQSDNIDEMARLLEEYSRQSSASSPTEDDEPIRVVQVGAHESWLCLRPRIESRIVTERGLSIRINNTVGYGDELGVIASVASDIHSTWGSRMTAIDDFVCGFLAHVLGSALESRFENVCVLGCLNIRRYISGMECLRVLGPGYDDHAVTYIWSGSMHIAIDMTGLYRSSRRDNRKPVGIDVFIAGDLDSLALMLSWYYGGVIWKVFRLKTAEEAIAIIEEGVGLDVENGASSPLTQERVRLLSDRLSEVYVFMEHGLISEDESYYIFGRLIAPQLVHPFESPQVERWIAETLEMFPELRQNTSLHLNDRFSPQDFLVTDNEEAIVLRGQGCEGKGSLVKALCDMSNLVVGGQDYASILTIGGQDFAATHFNNDDNRRNTLGLIRARAFAGMERIPAPWMCGVVVQRVVIALYLIDTYFGDYSDKLGERSFIIDPQPAVDPTYISIDHRLVFPVMDPLSLQQGYRDLAEELLTDHLSHIVAVSSPAHDLRLAGSKGTSSPVDKAAAQDLVGKAELEIERFVEWYNRVIDHSGVGLQGLGITLVDIKSQKVFGIDKACVHAVINMACIEDIQQLQDAIDRAMIMWSSERHRRMNAAKIAAQRPSGFDLLNRISTLGPKFYIKIDDIRGKRVIDIGAGAGQLLDWLVAKGALETYGIDISPGHFQAPILLQNNQVVSLLELDATDLSHFADGHFDAAFCISIFEWVPHRVRYLILREVRRVLKPGSVLYALVTHTQIYPESIIDPEVHWNEHGWRDKLVDLDLPQFEITPVETDFKMRDGGTVPGASLIRAVVVSSPLGQNSGRSRIILALLAALVPAFGAGAWWWLSRHSRSFDTFAPTQAPRDSPSQRIGLLERPKAPRLEVMPNFEHLRENLLVELRGLINKYEPIRESQRIQLNAAVSSRLEQELHKEFWSFWRYLVIKVIVREKVERGEWESHDWMLPEQDMWELFHDPVFEKEETYMAVRIIEIMHDLDLLYRLNTKIIPDFGMAPATARLYIQQKIKEDNIIGRLEDLEARITANRGVLEELYQLLGEIDYLSTLGWAKGIRVDSLASLSNRANIGISTIESLFDYDELVHFGVTDGSILRELTFVERAQESGEEKAYQGLWVYEVGVVMPDFSGQEEELDRFEELSRPPQKEELDRTQTLLRHLQQTIWEVRRASELEDVVRYLAPRAKRLQELFSAAEGQEVLEGSIEADVLKVRDLLDELIDVSAKQEKSSSPILDARIEFGGKKSGYKLAFAVTGVGRFIPVVSVLYSSSPILEYSLLNQISPFLGLVNEQEEPILLKIVMYLITGGFMAVVSAMALGMLMFILVNVLEPLVEFYRFLSERWKGFNVFILRLPLRFLHRSAAINLGNLKDSRALEPLIRYLRTTKPKDSEFSEVAKALGCIDDTRAVTPLVERLSVVGSDYPLVQALVDLGFDSIVPTITERLEHSEISMRRVTVDCLITLENMRTRQLLQGAVIARLDDLDYNIRTSAYRVLEMWGMLTDDLKFRKNMNDLTFEYTRGSYCGGSDAAKELAELGNARAIGPLTERVDHENRMMREAAFQALDQLGALTPDLRTRRYFKDLEDWFGQTPHSFKKAADALNDLVGEPGMRDRIIDAYLAVLETGYSDYVEISEEKLGNLGDRRVVRPLIHRSRDAGVGEYQVIVTALVKLGGEEAVSFLIEELRNRSSHMLAVVARAVVDLGERVEKIEELLIQVLGSDEAKVRAAACESLDKLQILPRELAIERLDDSDAGIRETAYATLDRLGLLTRGLRIQRYINDVEDPSAGSAKHQAAATALSQMGAIEALKPLKRLKSRNSKTITISRAPHSGGNIIQDNPLYPVVVDAVAHLKRVKRRSRRGRRGGASSPVISNLPSFGLFASLAMIQTDGNELAFKHSFSHESSIFIYNNFGWLIIAWIVSVLVYITVLHLLSQKVMTMEKKIREDDRSFIEEYYFPDDSVSGGFDPGKGCVIALMFWLTGFVALAMLGTPEKFPAGQEHMVKIVEFMGDMFTLFTLCSFAAIPLVFIILAIMAVITWVVYVPVVIIIAYMRFVVYRLYLTSLSFNRFILRMPFRSHYVGSIINIAKLGGEEAREKLLGVLLDPKDSNLNEDVLAALVEVADSNIFDDLVKKLKEVKHGYSKIVDALVGYTDEARMPVILEELKSQDHGKVVATIDALGKMTDERLQALARDPIVALINDPSLPKFISAIRALLNFDEESAVPLIIGNLNHPELDRRRSTVVELSRLSNEAAIALVRQPLIERLDDPEYYVRSAVANTLRELELLTPELIVRRSLNDLHDADSRIGTKSICYAMRAIGEYAEQATARVLIQRLDDPDLAIRICAVESLEKAGLITEEDQRLKIRRYIREINDSQVGSSVHMEAARFLGGIGATEALESLRQLLSRTPRTIQVSRSGHTGGTITQDNPLYPVLETAIANISRASSSPVIAPNLTLINEALETGVVDPAKIHDSRIVRFQESLRQKGFFEVLLMGGLIRDVFFDKEIGDFDLSVKMKFTAQEKRDFKSLTCPANERVYFVAMRIMRRLAVALGFPKDAFDDPFAEDVVEFEGLKVQHAGVIRIEYEPGAEIIQKNYLVDAETGESYLTHSGASLLQLSMDCQGKLYGNYRQALEDLRRGRVRIAGGGVNFVLGDILRLLRLKHQYGLKIEWRSYIMLKRALSKLRGGVGVSAGMMSPGNRSQLEKTLTKAQDRDAAKRDLEKLGIFSIVEQIEALESKGASSPHLSSPIVRSSAASPTGDRRLRLSHSSRSSEAARTLAKHPVRQYLAQPSAVLKFSSSPASEFEGSPSRRFHAGEAVLKSSSPTSGFKGSPARGRVVEYVINDQGVFDSTMQMAISSLAEMERIIEICGGGEDPFLFIAARRLAIFAGEYIMVDRRPIPSTTPGLTRIQKDIFDIRPDDELFVGQKDRIVVVSASSLDWPLICGANREKLAEKLASYPVAVQIHFGPFAEEEIFAMKELMAKHGWTVISFGLIQNPFFSAFIFLRDDKSVPPLIRGFLDSLPYYGFRIQASSSPADSASQDSDSLLDLRGLRPVDRDILTIAGIHTREDTQRRTRKDLFVGAVRAKEAGFGFSIPNACERIEAVLENQVGFALAHGEDDNPIVESDPIEVITYFAPKIEVASRGTRMQLPWSWKNILTPLNGVHEDVRWLKKAGFTIALLVRTPIAEIEEKVRAIAGYQFNMSSLDKIDEILFEHSHGKLCLHSGRFSLTQRFPRAFEVLEIFREEIPGFDAAGGDKLDADQLEGWIQLAMADRTFEVKAAEQHAAVVRAIQEGIQSAAALRKGETSRKMLVGDKVMLLWEMMRVFFLPTLETPQEIADALALDESSRVLTVGGAVAPFVFLRKFRSVRAVEIEVRQLGHLDSVKQAIPNDRTKEFLDMVWGIFADVVTDPLARRFIREDIQASYDFLTDEELREKLLDDRLILQHGDLVLGNEGLDERFDAAYYSTLPVTATRAPQGHLESIVSNITTHLNRGTTVVFTAYTDCDEHRAELKAFLGALPRDVRRRSLRSKAEPIVMYVFLTREAPAGASSPAQRGNDNDRTSLPDDLREILEIDVFDLRLPHLETLFDRRNHPYVSVHEKAPRQRTGFGYRVRYVIAVLGTEYSFVVAIAPHGNSREGREKGRTLLIARDFLERYMTFNMNGGIRERIELIRKLLERARRFTERHHNPDAQGKDGSGATSSPSSTADSSNGMQSRTASQDYSRGLRLSHSPDDSNYPNVHRPKSRILRVEELFDNLVQKIGRGTLPSYLISDHLVFLEVDRPTLEALYLLTANARYNLMAAPGARSPRLQPIDTLYAALAEFKPDHTDESPGVSSPLSLARNRPYTQIWDVLSRIEDMASYELVKALELDKARLVSVREESAINLTIHTIRTPQRRNMMEPPVGIEVLHNELAPTREFELLYNKDGYLIAIFPVVTRALKLTRLTGKKHRYFDFTAYNFQIPAIGDPEARQKWQEFALKSLQDLTAIKHYTYYFKISDVVEQVRGSEQKSYVYAEIVPKGYSGLSPFSMPYAIQFDPQDILLDVDHSADRVQLERMFSGREDIPFIVFPVFPTVYSPGAREHAAVDHNYMVNLYEQARKAGLKDGDRSLINCAGSGYDTWLVWEATHQPVYAAEINPLGVANVRATAKQGGFEVEVKQHDNIASKDGKFAFGDTEFQFIATNAPFSENGDDHNIDDLMKKRKGRITYNTFVKISTLGPNHPLIKIIFGVSALLYLIPLMLAKKPLVFLASALCKTSIPTGGSI